MIARGIARGVARGIARGITRGGTTRWSPADLFASGEEGALWGPLPYYSDAAGTVEAAWGDPVGFIPDASGNELDWTQVTSTARPILGRVPVGGRRNLLTWTEDFSNEAWVKGGVTIAPGIKAPNGVSLGKLVEGLENRTQFARQSITFPANSTSIQTLYAKAGERSWIYFGGLGRLPSAMEGYTWFNLADGTIGTVSEHHTILEYASIGDGVYKIVILCAAAPTSTIREFRVGASTEDTTQAYQGDGVSGVYVGGAQLETGSVATPYQRVGNEYDITEAGVATVHYLRFDGTDDQVTTTLPAISGGTIVLAGTNGIWIDEIDFAGGEFSVGPDTYTGGPAGLLSILGDILVEGGFVIDRALTPEEVAQVEKYYVARGSAGLIELSTDHSYDFGAGIAPWYNGVPERGDVTSVDGRMRVANNYANGSSLGFTKSVVDMGESHPGAGFVWLSFNSSGSTTLTVVTTTENSNGTGGAVIIQGAASNYNRIHMVSDVFRYLAAGPANSADELYKDFEYISLRRLIMPGDTP